MESPLALRELRGMQLKEYDGVFNLTMTYKYGPFYQAVVLQRNK